MQSNSIYTEILQAFMEKCGAADTLLAVSVQQARSTNFFTGKFSEGNVQLASQKHRKQLVRNYTKLLLARLFICIFRKYLINRQYDKKWQHREK